MQLLSVWTFGTVALLTILFFGVAYIIGRQVRTFWKWANGDAPPKEKVVVFFPLSLLAGLLVSGFVQAFYDTGTICHQYQQPLISCTIQNIGNLPARR